MKVTGEFRLKGTLAIGFAPDIPPIPPALFIGVRKNILDLLRGFLGQEFLGAFAKEIQIGLVHAAVAVDIAIAIVLIVTVTVASIIGVFFFDIGRFLSPATDAIAGFRADHQQECDRNQWLLSRRQPCRHRFGVSRGPCTRRTSHLSRFVNPIQDGFNIC